eukprot:TRINITY_DN4409_c0_g2_i1.p1 TRINITY_DN4409_c0_g2~~TRINITY_DN4409_c0_g2_i1.p1  ORF type:complete len:129 (+),score=19.15 TRINITY_DN4409_c0_g2_i1:107-493(+)
MGMSDEEMLRCWDPHFLYFLPRWADVMKSMMGQIRDLGHDQRWFACLLLILYVFILAIYVAFMLPYCLFADAISTVFGIMLFPFAALAGVCMQLEGSGFMVIWGRATLVPRAILVVVLAILWCMGQAN